MYNETIPTLLIYPMKYLNAPLLPYDSSRWIVGKVMKAMWKLLNESPALREKYAALAEINLFSLSFCGHRQCENEYCAERAELLWDGYVKFLKYLITFGMTK